MHSMCWHLTNWGEHVTVERPAKLLRTLAAICAGLAE